MALTRNLLEEGFIRYMVDNIDAGNGRHHVGAEAAVDPSAVEAEESTETLTPGSPAVPVEADKVTDAWPGPPARVLAPMRPAAPPFSHPGAGRPAAGLTES